MCGSSRSVSLCSIVMGDSLGGSTAPIAAFMATKGAAGSPSQEGRERGPSDNRRGSMIDDVPSERRSSLVPCSGPNARIQEPAHVFRGELDLQRCTQRVDVEVPQILIEIA